MHEAANNYEKLKQIGEKYGISQDIVNQHAASFQGGVNIPFGIGALNVGHLGANYEKSETSVATANAATEELNQLMKSDSYRDSMSHMNQASKSTDFNTNNQRLNSLADNMSTSFEKSKSFEQQSNKAREISDSLRMERSTNRTQGMRVDANLTQDFVNHVGADRIAGKPPQPSSLNQKWQIIGNLCFKKSIRFRSKTRWTHSIKGTSCRTATRTFRNPLNPDKHTYSRNLKDRLEKWMLRINIDRCR